MPTGARRAGPRPRPRPRRLSLTPAPSHPASRKDRAPSSRGDLASGGPLRGPRFASRLKSEPPPEVGPPGTPTEGVPFGSRRTGADWRHWWPQGPWCPARTPPSPQERLDQFSTDPLLTCGVQDRAHVRSETGTPQISKKHPNTEKKNKNHKICHSSLQWASGT